MTAKYREGMSVIRCGGKPWITEIIPERGTLRSLNYAGKLSSALVVGCIVCSPILLQEDM